MAFYVKKVHDGVDTLPLPSETDLAPQFGELYECARSHRQLVRLYEAIMERENYFQFYSPTAFGSPQYERLAGKVQGFLLAMEAEETQTETEIIIRKNNRKLLVVEKPMRPESYYEELRDCRRTQEAVFG